MSREIEYESIGYDELLRDDELAWLPKAECEIDEDAMEISVPDWLIIDRGIG